MRNIHDLDSIFKDYFSNVTEEQLEKDFEKAEWEVYSKIEESIFDEFDPHETPMIALEHEADATYPKMSIGSYQIEVKISDEIRPRYFTKTVTTISSNQDSIVGPISNIGDKLAHKSATEESISWEKRYAS
jgi:hypothetical protein